MRTVRRCRRGRRGFSLLEALIAAAILGVGLLALARLHIASIQGTVKSEDIGRAAEVARGIADTLATLPWTSLPTCGPGPTSLPTWINPPVADGCSAALGPTNQFRMPERGPGCTAWYNFDAVPDINNAGWLQDPMSGDGSPPDSGNFRVDLAVSQHPDPAGFPTSLGADPGQEPVAVLWIWVCWRDSNGGVHEISSTRVMTQGL